jgi:hypothetical protein
MEIKRGKKKIVSEAGQEKAVKVVQEIPEPVFEPVKTQQIINKMLPIVVATVDTEGQELPVLPTHVLVLTEKRGFKFVSKILSKGTYDECTQAMNVYRRKFGTGRNERLHVTKV